MKKTSNRTLTVLTKDRIEHWYRKGMTTSIIARNLKVDYMKVYNEIKRLKAQDEAAYKAAERETEEYILNSDVMDTIVDVPVKVNFQMKIYGISIKVTRVPSEVIFEDDYIEIN